MTKPVLNFKVDKNLCIKCGLCVEDCPVKIIESGDQGLPFVSPARELACMECQHCLAVCPTGALSLLGINPNNSTSLSQENLPSSTQVSTLIKGRRSVRKYKQINVDRAKVDYVLSTVANCPTGVNKQDLVFTVVDDIEFVNNLRENMMSDLVQAAAVGAIPERFDYLKKLIFLWKKRQVDVIFRTAPHFIIISASNYSSCPTEDVNIALSYFELMAQSAGLGTTWCGLLKMALEVLPKYKKKINLPPNSYYYPMLFGLPAIRYSRTVQRNDSAVINRIKL